MKRTNLLLLLLLIAVTTYGQMTNNTIDSLIKETMEKYKIPAMAASFITLDSCFLGIGGTTKVNGSALIKPVHKFHLGSNTKAITSFIAFKMIEQKQVKLSSTFLDLFPEFKNKILDDYNSITLSDLLSHQAGIQPYVSGLEFEKLPKLEKTASENRYDFAKFVLNEKPVAKGTYSNAGFTLASLMLEKVAGKSFEDLLAETMGDLDLTFSTGFPNKESEANPWGHWVENEKLIALDAKHFYKLEDFMLATGDVSMNIVDYSKWIQIHLKGLNGTDNYLAATSYLSMHFGKDEYSFGWGNTLVNNQRWSFHDGSTGTYYCHTVLLPDAQKALVVMMNAGGEDHIAGLYELRELIYASLIEK